MSLLPLLTLFCTTIYLHGIGREVDWRHTVLRSSILWGVFTVLSTEILSLFNALTQEALALLWGAAFLLVALGLFSTRQSVLLSLRSFEPPRPTKQWILWMGLGMILVLTWIVAVKSPPQTWDSLNYHMSRVAHWAQQTALRHYATGIEVQNNMPPGAEIFVAHTYILSQSDTWVNLVQWLAMVGCLLGGSWLAAELGAGRQSQLLSAVFIATLPMGIAEATSTMTDYVLAFWLVCVAVQTLVILKDPKNLATAGFLGLATGLTILTKPTAYAYLLPFAAIILWSLFRKARSRFVLISVLVLALVGAINAGHFLRNQETYGNPIGPPERFEQHGNQLLSLPGLISNQLRNIALHLQTPSPYLNKALVLGVDWVHDLLNLDVNDPRTTAAGRFKISSPTTNEILIGNLLHMLIVLASVFVLIGRQKEFDPILKTYAFAVIVASFVFSFMFKWLIFGSRLQLPFFVLMAPVVTAIVKPKMVERWGVAFGAGLILLSLPWLVGIETRPLIPLSRGSSVESILTEEPLKLTFANGLYLMEPTRDVILRIEESQCTQIGILFSGNGVEYPFWSLLHAPREELHIEWIVRGTYSDKYAEDDFSPCAIVCENCTFQGEKFLGMTAVHERAPYRLYLSELKTQEDSLLE